jgi:hypothetical protein
MLNTMVNGQLWAIKEKYIYTIALKESYNKHGVEKASSEKA